METTESTEESRSRSLEVHPSSEGPETTSEPIPSSGGSPRSTLEAVTVPATLCKEAHGPYSILTEPSSDSLLEAACPRPHHIGHGRFGYQPLCVSYVPRNPCASDPSSSPVPTSSHPGHSSGHSSGPGSGSGSGLGQSSDTGQGSKGPATGPALAHGPGLASGPGPADSEPGHKFSSSVPQGFGNPPPDLLPHTSTWDQYCYCVPCHQPWEPLQVSEPGVRGPWKPPEVERKSEFLCKTRPRGQCLLYNWDEERATNHLDQIPRSQDGSESYFFRHGHQGLLSIQPQSPMPSSTTQTDSYQPPRNVCQPLRGVKHERPVGRQKETGPSGGIVDCLVVPRANPEIPPPLNSVPDQTPPLPSCREAGSYAGGGPAPPDLRYRLSKNLQGSSLRLSQ
ncbi:sperm-associated antigen 8 isoform X2 [Onychomys torridus]|uniref:sperm-associated antigen 8 isoform X2 n=1 Tax=Onychomys torridus TaxID=38674 RepID=UPI00167F3A88|nr:sperm-associated antigen 8 isoform X2 [Onychomys torridus]